MMRNIYSYTIIIQVISATSPGSKRTKDTYSTNVLSLRDIKTDMFRRDKRCGKCGVSQR